MFVRRATRPTRRTSCRGTRPAPGHPSDRRLDAGRDCGRRSRGRNRGGGPPVYPGRSSDEPKPRASTMSGTPECSCSRRSARSLPPTSTPLARLGGEGEGHRVTRRRRLASGPWLPRPPRASPPAARGRGAPARSRPRHSSDGAAAAGRAATRRSGTRCSSASRARRVAVNTCAAVVLAFWDGRDLALHLVDGSLPRAVPPGRQAQGGAAVRSRMRALLAAPAVPIQPLGRGQPSWTFVGGHHLNPRTSSRRLQKVEPGACPHGSAG